MFLPLHAIAGVPASTKAFPLFLAWPVELNMCLARSLDIHYIVIIIVFLLLLWDNISCKPIGKQEHPIWPLFSTVCCQAASHRQGRFFWESVLLSSMAISDMLARCHSFYQKLFLPPPWVEYYPWEYQGRLCWWPAPTAQHHYHFHCLCSILSTSRNQSSAVFRSKEKTLLFPFIILHSLEV